MKELIQATIEIMMILGLELRPNYSQDGPINLRAWDELKGYNALFRIESDIDGVVNSDRPNEMYYTDPVIVTSHDLKIILAKFENSQINVEARSIVVHELTHWLQKGTMEELHTRKGYVEFNGTNYLDYISQRTEREAHSVQAFYYLRELHPEKLEEVINSSEIDVEKLINTFMTIRGRPSVFH